MTATTTDTAKLVKASAERVRKAKKKAGETSAPQTVVVYSADAEAFVIGTVTPGGDCTTDGSPSFDSMDDAKSYLKSAAASIEPSETPEPDASEQPRETADEPEVVERREFTPRELFLFVFDQFATDTAEVGKVFFDGDTKKARRELRKLERRGLVCATDVNNEAQGGSRRGSFKTLAYQSAVGTYDDLSRDEAAKAYDDLEAAESETKAKRDPSVPRSRGRKLIAVVDGESLIIRMSERAQAKCVELTGSLPKIGDVVFERAADDGDES